jgi:transposase
MPRRSLVVLVVASKWLTRRSGRCRQVAADRVADGGINRLKQWRGIATRFDKRPVNYRAGVVIVSLLLWFA